MIADIKACMTSIAGSRSRASQQSFSQQGVKLGFCTWAQQAEHSLACLVHCTDSWPRQCTPDRRTAQGKPCTCHLFSGAGAVQAHAISLLGANGLQSISHAAIQRFCSKVQMCVQGLRTCSAICEQLLSQAVPLMSDLDVQGLRTCLAYLTPTVARHVGSKGGAVPRCSSTLGSCRMAAQA